MQIKFKKLLASAVMPRRGSAFAAGWDLTAVSMEQANDTNVKGGYDPMNYCWVYHTGIAVELPVGTCGLLMPRSSIYRTNSILSNSVGLLDCDYRGEILFKFFGMNPPYQIGDRIGQLVVMNVPEVEFVEVKTLSETERGTGGYGSTGR